ncbi:MAG TPA: ATP-binding cassette domain-containing protein, partial [Vicinamibacterales bacterium]|nr:ATP-binding cassette domain-containing protein [Vicinamibacterales bacterium]
MAADTSPVLELRSVRKAYGGLRPLRLDALTLARGESAAVLNLEMPAVEVLMNLVTGVTLPDEGEVRLFGRATASIENGDEWLALLDRLGIISERVVLLEQLSIVQNLAVPFTLALDEIPAAVQPDIARLRSEVGLAEGMLDELVGRAAPDARIRLRLARALALDPHLLLLEHPTAGLPRDGVERLARDIRTIAERRELTVLILTADRPFAEAAARNVFAHQPA